jgi:hypothetical protein
VEEQPEQRDGPTGVVLRERHAVVTDTDRARDVERRGERDRRRERLADAAAARAVLAPWPRPSAVVATAATAARRASIAIVAGHVVLASWMATSASRAAT